jgi:hypothetical protein
MNCEQAKEHFADYWSGTLELPAARDFEDHLRACAGCREEAESLGEKWRILGLLAAEEPSRALRGRFYRSLEAYTQGRDNAARPRLSGWAWWWGRPAFQFGFAAAMLLAGVGIGHLITANGRSKAEVAELQGELRGMRQMVTLALLQQQSASDRLRGVDFSAAADQGDTQVVSALLTTLAHDSNVNVRLAAVDALRRFAGSPMVRQRLNQALAAQDSPLVQISVIDLLVETGQREAVPAMRALARQANLNPEVKERIQWGLGRLQ